MEENKLSKKGGFVNDGEIGFSLRFLRVGAILQETGKQTFSSFYQYQPNFLKYTIVSLTSFSQNDDPELAILELSITEFLSWL